MRATLRISVRSIRRHPWRSAIVVALITLPVALLVGFVASLAGSEAHQREMNDQQLRGAQLLYGGIESVGPGTTPDQLRQQLGLRRTAVLTPITDGQLAQQRADGTADVLSWVEADWSSADARRLSGLTDGDWPSRPGEVAVADRSHPIGSTYETSLPSTTVTVVGWIKRTSSNFATTDLLAAAGTFPDAREGVWSSSALGPPQQFWRISGIDSATLERLSQNSSYSVVTSTVRTQLASVGLATFGFIWCGLVAASALAIGARRRRRELGLLATNGATPRQLRAAIIADGFVLGGVGALLGTGLGLAGAAWWNDIGLEWTGRVAGDGWRFTPVVVAAPLMGWLSAIAAGAIAGRGVSHQPTVDLLAGRAPRPGSAPRWLGVGLGSAGVCFALGLMAAAMDGSGRGRPTMQIACAAAGVVALIAISVGLIRTLPAWTAGRGLTLRTAAKDLARFGARTTGATAAIAITLSGATFASLGEREAAAQHAADLRAQASNPDPRPSVATLGAQRRAIVSGRLVDAGLSSAQISALDRRGERDGFAVSTMRVTNHPEVRVCIGNPTALATELGFDPSLFDGDGCLSTTAVEVPTAEIANFDATTRDALDAGQLVGYSNVQTNTPTEATFRVGTSSTALTPVAPPDLYTDMKATPFTQALTSGSDALVTVLVPEAAWTPELDRSATNLATIVDQRSREGEAWYVFLDRLGLGVRSSNSAYTSSSWSAGLIWAAGGGIALVCLIVLTLALVLVRIESQDEESVLSTQGASRAVIARICGWRAALVTWTAAVPAVVLSLAFAWVVGRQFRFPHPISLAMLLVGMPVLAGLIFGATGLRRPRPPVTTA